MEFNLMRVTFHKNLGIGWTATELRLTFHCDISRELAQKACAKMETVIKSMVSSC